MLVGERAVRVRRAVERVEQAGRELEEARAQLVLDAHLAVAAGADLDAVAGAAGVRPETLKMWLTSAKRPDRGHVAGRRRA